MKVMINQLLNLASTQRLVEKTAALWIVMVMRYQLKVCKGEHEHLFNEVWQCLMRNPVYKALLRCIRHPHQLLPQEWLMIRLMTRFRKQSLPLNLNINLHMDAADRTALITEQQQGMFISLHNGINYFLKNMADLGLPATTITADPDDILSNGAIFLNKIEKEVTLIPRDASCLIKLRAAAKAKNNIYLCVDFEEGDDRRFRYVSPTFFSFANKMKLPIYFVKETIQTNGKVDITVKRYINNNQNTDKKQIANDSAEAFVAYVGTSYPHYRRTLSVKQYSL